MIKTISSREKELYKDFVESKIFSNREEVYFRFTVDKIKALQNKKKIYSNFLCQLFHVKEDKLLAIRVLTAIEQVFGIYVSVFFEYSYREEELIKFLFRSEETVEWITGARELGKRALHDSGYKEIFSTYLKDKSYTNVHTLRHALTALLSYLTESVKTGKKEEEFSLDEIVGPPSAASKPPAAKAKEPQADFDPLKNLNLDIEAPSDDLLSELIEQSEKPKEVKKEAPKILSEIRDVTDIFGGGQIGRASCRERV